MMNQFSKILLKKIRLFEVRQYIVQDTQRVFSNF